MKKLTVVLLACVVLITGCAGKNQGIQEDTQEKANMTIGICFDTFVVERWLKDRDVFTYTAKELGATVDVQNANGDIQKQREQIQHLIDEDVDALVIVAIDGDQIEDLLDTAKKKGIKIIAYDRMIDSEDIDLCISFDNQEVGRLMANGIYTSTEGKRVLMICGPQSDKNVDMVINGFSEEAKKDGLETADIVYIDGWRAENVDTYFDNHPEILNNVDAIMCGNDNLAGEVIQILSENRLAGKIIVTGQDADLEACQRIVEGTQQMTVYKEVEKLAKVAAEDTVKLIDGKELQTEEMKISDGTIPYISLSTVAVDKNNMDQVIIQSGFHLKEDVFLNIAQ